MPTLTTRPLVQRLSDRFARLPGGADREAMARLVYDELRVSISFDFACMATTDPATGLVTWASKTRSLGVGDEEFAASEYGPPDINKFEDLVHRQPPVGALWLDTDGDPYSCRRHREFMQPRFGFTDELRAVCISRGASWGALGVYRGPGDPPFTADDVDEVAAACDVIAVAIQRRLFGGTETVDRSGAGVVDSPAPAVLVVDAHSKIVQQTPAVHDAIEDLGGLDHGELPESLLAVVVTCRTTGAPFVSRVKTRSGSWISLRASPLEGASADPDVVVSMDPTPRSALSRLALTAHGLTAREEDVALLVLQGVNTQEIAATLHLSPHTVQDHLKKIFTKTGVNSRRELTAKLVLT